MTPGPGTIPLDTMQGYVALRGLRLPLALAATSAAPPTACGGGAGAAAAALRSPPPPAKKGKYFKHVVIVVQENRSFDNLFATFPGADGTTVGNTHNGKLPLRETDLNSALGTNHGYPQWIKEYDGGKDGWLRSCSARPALRVRRTAADRAILEACAEYVLSDHTFQTQGSGSFTAHQDLITRRHTRSATRAACIDSPTSSTPWGCDAPPGTRHVFDHRPTTVSTC